MDSLRSLPERFAAMGDPHAAIDEKHYSIEPLLELAEKQKAAGEQDAPWPPNYARQEGEPPRVQPSRRRKKKEETPPASGAGFTPA